MPTRSLMEMLDEFVKETNVTAEIRLFKVNIGYEIEYSWVDGDNVRSAKDILFNEAVNSTAYKNELFSVVHYSLLAKVKK